MKTNKEIARDLLIINSKLDKFELGENTILNNGIIRLHYDADTYVLLNIALDILGVPSDNTVDFDPQTGKFITIDGSEPYSREYIEQKWTDMGINTTVDDIDTYIEWVLTNCL